MVDVEGVRIFPRAPELFGAAVAVDGHGSVHALHVRVQAAPNGHLRNAWLMGTSPGLQGISRQNRDLSKKTGDETIKNLDLSRKKTGDITIVKTCQERDSIRFHGDNLDLYSGDSSFMMAKLVCNSNSWIYGRCNMIYG